MLNIFFNIIAVKIITDIKSFNHKKRKNMFTKTTQFAKTTFHGLNPIKKTLASLALISSVTYCIIPIITPVLGQTYYLLSMQANDKLVHERAQFLFNTKYSSNARYKSIQTDDVSWIKDKMTQTTDYQTFAGLAGSKGIGKTTAIKTAAHGLPGVIILERTAPGTTEEEIVRRACQKINGLPTNDTKRAKSIIEAYKSISGGQAPILIIPATRRLVHEHPAKLSDAGQTLSEDYKLNVLIDAEENAMPVKAELTLREDIREMEPMTDDMIRQLPQFKELFEYLNEKKNDQVVLAVCNGCPALVGVLNAKLTECAASERDTKVIKFVEQELTKTFISLDNLKRLYPNISQVCKRYM
jgi:hypothetical protein